MQGREAVLLAGWPLTCCFYTLPAPFCSSVLSLAPLGALYFSSILADKFGPPHLLEERGGQTLSGQAGAREGWDPALAQSKLMSGIV